MKDDVKLRTMLELWHSYRRTLPVYQRLRAKTQEYYQDLQDIQGLISAMAKWQPGTLLICNMRLYSVKYVSMRLPNPEDMRPYFDYSISHVKGVCMFDLVMDTGTISCDGTRFREATKDEVRAISKTLPKLPKPRKPSGLA